MHRIVPPPSLASLALRRLLSSAALGALAASPIEALPQLVEALTPVPMQASISYAIPDGTTSMCETITQVDAGERLVIEYASLLAGSASGERVRAAQIRTRVNEKLVFHLLDVHSTETFEESLAAHLVRIYADPVTEVSICVDRPFGDGLMTVFASISGHLETLP